MIGYNLAVALVIRTQKAGLAHIQRNIKCSYTAASRWLEQMEKDGIVSPIQADGSRKVLKQGDAK